MSDKDILILVLLAVFAAIFMMSQKEARYATDVIEEPFWDLTSTEPNCLDCYYKSPQECNDCGNCGVCVNGSFSKCIPGDVQGPYFNQGCEKWIYTDHKKGKINEERETIVARPWSWQYPQQRLLGRATPSSRAALR